jgi:HD-GYP domain-containing protein (c-di-GMP phosphodiesterase class II)
MIADRPYRAGMSPDAAREELERCAGTQFDPDVLAAFLRAIDAERDCEDSDEPESRTPRPTAPMAVIAQRA